MDLKFTFAKPAAETKQFDTTAPGTGALPFTVSSPGSSELVIHVTATDTALIAVALGAADTQYAKQQRQLNAAGADAAAYRSVISRAIAELDEKLASAVTGLRVPAAAVPQLLAADFITAQATTTELLQLRSGLNAGTPVQTY